MSRRPQISMTAAVAVGTLFVLSPNLPLNHVPSEDEGVFLYIARTIAASPIATSGITNRLACIS